ncbi:MAG: hypothetical protein ONB23_07470 [candidate division KSB1 bacterium]|nr:hypothetical protein [candidate division KSB1 bacterium]
MRGRARTRAFDNTARRQTRAGVLALLLWVMTCAPAFPQPGRGEGEQLLSALSPTFRGVEDSSLVRSRGRQESSPGKIGPGAAAFRSLILPGWGQRSAGSRTGFRVFLGTELGLWAAYAAFRSLAEWKEDAYRLFAIEHAGIDPAGKDKQFYVNIENYDSLEDYNQAKLRERNLQDYYRDRQRYAWRWDSPTNRRLYEQMRVESDRYANRAELTVGGILANHLASAVHALWVSRKQTAPSSARSRTTWDWQLRFFPRPLATVWLRIGS